MYGLKPVLFTELNFSQLVKPGPFQAIVLDSFP
jgi:hypothetical protein